MNNRDLTQALIESQKIDQVFCFYDEPKLYSCRLDDGNRYIVFWADEDREKQLWFYVRIGDCRFNALLENEVSLREIFESCEDGYVFTVALSKEGKCSIGKILSSQVSSELLPKRDVYLLPPKPRTKL